MDLSTEDGILQDWNQLLESGLKDLLPPDRGPTDVSVMPPIRGAPWRDVYYSHAGSDSIVRYRRSDADGMWTVENLKPFVSATAS